LGTFFRYVWAHGFKFRNPIFPKNRISWVPDLFFISWAHGFKFRNPIFPKNRISWVPDLFSWARYVWAHGFKFRNPIFQKIGFLGYLIYCLGHVTFGHTVLNLEIRFSKKLDFLAT
jgi:hypothetical protein